MNALDLELYDYAKGLLAKRLKFIPELTLTVRKTSSKATATAQCGEFHRHYHPAMSSRSSPNMSPLAALPGPLRSHIGIFRPPGHKGPL